MRIKKGILRMAAAAAVCFPLLAFGQGSSINTYSPYTMYGLGDMNTPGASFMRSMGGTGVGYRSQSKINDLNPASMAAGLQRAFLLNVGLEGGNYYLKSGDLKSSFNTFNIRDIAIQLPISSRIGFGVSVSPFSSVGYRIQQTETDPSVVDDLKRVTYKYEGQGGLTQIKAGVGVSASRRLALGAEMVYYLGHIDRTFQAQLITFSDEIQGNIYGEDKNKVSRVMANFGVQYNAIMTPKRLLTVGATFQPKGKLNPTVERYIPSGNVSKDTVSYSSQLSNFYMPDMLTLGLFYRTTKAGIGADYSWAGWGTNNNGGLLHQGMSYRNTSSIKIGGEYTPNRLDVRRFMNRLTYRAGLRYADYYMGFNGYNIDEKAVTVGVGIPFKMGGMSDLNLGLEFGTRGRATNGLVRENYFKFSIGLSLFGEDYWFVKPKYD